MKKQILFICCAVIAYCLSACNTAPQQVPLKEKNLPKHVILIGFDGLSAHCLNNGGRCFHVRESFDPAFVECL